MQWAKLAAGEPIHHQCLAKSATSLPGNICCSLWHIATAAALATCCYAPAAAAAAADVASTCSVAPLVPRYKRAAKRCSQAYLVRFSYMILLHGGAFTVHICCYGRRNCPLGRGARTLHLTSGSAQIILLHPQQLG